MTAGTTKDIANKLADQVKNAYSNGSILGIRGSGTKSFLGNSDLGQKTAESITTTKHQGIVNYEPNELVLTARSGTRLHDIQNTLAGKNQMLAFEPPAFGEQATLGGTIACALSGPRRPYTGSARDYVLGVHMINGRGETMRFGGQVMKNVAGYDVSRLMTGAMGTLGIILDISLKVLPLPEVEMTLVQDLTSIDARKRMVDLVSKYSPISAMSYVGHFLYIRLSGPQSAVTAAIKKIGGETILNHETFWHDIREQQHPFFKSDKPLWRLSLPVASDWPGIEEKLNGDCLVEWGGAQVWLSSGEAPEKIFAHADTLGGHARLFRSLNDGFGYRCQPLAPALLNWHKKIKHVFDPKGILNPGIMYKEV